MAAFAKLGQVDAKALRVGKRDVALSASERGVEVEAVAHVGDDDERRRRLVVFEVARVAGRLVLGGRHGAFPRRRSSDAVPFAALATFGELLVDALLGFEHERSALVQVGPSDALGRAVDKADRPLEDVGVLLDVGRGDARNLGRRAADRARRERAARCCAPRPAPCSTA